MRHQEAFRLFILTVIAGLYAARLTLQPGRIFARGVRQTPPSSIASATPAEAEHVPPPVDLRVCNQTRQAGSEPIYVAVAYYDAAIGDWIARGWYSQQGTGCHEVFQHLTPPVFVYAETKTGSKHWGGAENGHADAPPAATFCVHERDGFTLAQNRCDAPAGRHERRRVAFVELPSDGGSTLSWVLRDLDAKITAGGGADPWGL